MSTPSIGRRAENAKPSPGVMSMFNPQNRGGKAATLALLAFLLVLALALAAGLFLWATPSDQTGPERGASPSGAVSKGQGPTSEGQTSTQVPSEAPRDPSDDGLQSGRDPAADGVGVQLQNSGKPPSEDPSRFRGKGTLRGQILLPEGATLTEPWAVSVGPSPWLVGAEKAELRRVEMHADERTFKLEGLPLAGYQITIEALGWTNQPANVLIQKGADDVFATLQLERNATVEGSLFRDNGVPAEGIPARLEALEGDLVFETTVDIAGKFLFEGVPEGNWRLLLGPPTSPHLPAQLLDVRRPGLVLRQVMLPPLTWFRLIYLDADDNPIPDVKLTGSGNQGGIIKGLTDEFGVFVGRNIKPGRWTVRAAHPDYKSRRHLFVVELEEPYEETLVLLP